ncbi:MAG: hypothetical protein ACT6QU_02165 [Aliihoeflea sp.]|uniref:hypothetical protein n=1 Tax=Aliihoeflea sp. TaxID=2608088 RepID=UPI0040341F84
MAYAAKAGFYGGTYFKSGQALPAGAIEDEVSDLSGLTKAQLLERADAEGVAVNASATKAEIITALETLKPTS